MALRITISSTAADSLINCCRLGQTTLASSSFVSWKNWATLNPDAVSWVSGSVLVFFATTLDLPVYQLWMLLMQGFICPKARISKESRAFTRRNLISNPSPPIPGPRSLWEVYQWDIEQPLTQQVYPNFFTFTLRDPRRAIPSGSEKFFILDNILLIKSAPWRTWTPDIRFWRPAFYQLN